MLRVQEIERAAPLHSIASSPYYIPSPLHALERLVSVSA